jgi:AraC-like DNA-binding protein
VFVANFPMRPGDRFEWHTHTDHQLAWAPQGVLTVFTNAATFVLPPSRALFIPAGEPHEVRTTSIATMRPLYIRPQSFPITWTQPTPVVATPLLAELIDHLDTSSINPAARKRAEAVLADLLRPIAVRTIDVPMPAQGPAREVADALVGQPEDDRPLAQWGPVVGASERTLARAFVADTGIPFGRWRTLVRLRAALPLLAAGSTITTVSRQIGYRTPSAFVAAFKRETGLTPGTYFTPTT